MRYSKSQLNAISRSYAEKHRKEALQELSDMGVDYDTYCSTFNYRSSPTMLLTSIKKKQKKTLMNIQKLKEV